MYKVKNNIDLKEFEKYGFRFINLTTEQINSFWGWMGLKNCIMECSTNDIGITKDKYIEMTDYEDMIDIDLYEDKLQELLNANLIEKVEN